MKDTVLIMVGFSDGHDTVEHQLNKQGLTLGAKAGVYEKIRECMDFLENEKVLSEKDIEKAYNRLVPKFIEDTRWKEGI